MAIIGHPLAKNSGDRPMPPNKKAVPTTGTDAQRALRQASPADRSAKQMAASELCHDVPP